MAVTTSAHEIFGGVLVSPQALGEHLVELVSNRSRYLELFEWKRNGYSGLRSEFREMMAECDAHHKWQQGCLLCDRVLEMRRRNISDITSNLLPPLLR